MGDGSGGEFGEAEAVEAGGTHDDAVGGLGVKGDEDAYPVVAQAEVGWFGGGGEDLV
ncbi:hypothetical protein J4573_40025 [Actinomadura barringtoniae]|uniref:Uncharacterized protein n=1 Tax=Actinomadura barringtoniae TaxID=1427535 RepID=A0A939T8N5_9ACTN|nr:hypothetical protein [Actinomadura barringtoniae]MBO2453339.1 hypothetical protein [Actinomadura barringtoniae]